MKTKLRNKIATGVQAFADAGGKIQQVGYGVTGVKKEVTSATIKRNVDQAGYYEQIKTAHELEECGCYDSNVKTLCGYRR